MLWNQSVLTPDQTSTVWVYHWMTDNIVSVNPQNKSFAENTEEVDIDSIEWKYNDDNICPQCGHNHSHKPGTTILNMISFLDRDSS